MLMEIVGLKIFVQDDVNKLIFKFVGVKPHPLTFEIKTLVRFLKTGQGMKEIHLLNLFLMKFCTVALVTAF